MRVIRGLVLVQVTTRAPPMSVFAR